jgi:transposase InsO family protein
MYAMLRRLRVHASRSAVRRAYVELRLLRRPAPRRVRTTNSRHEHPRHPNLVRELVVERPDQVWVADVTYIRVQRRFAYLALLMDVFTRRIVGWGFSLANDTRLSLQALEMALALGRSPEVHHGDQGANYACDEYVRRLQARGVCISMAAAGAPYENGYAERLNRTVKDEETRPSDYRNFIEARCGLETFIARYNRQRIHSSLAYKTPSEVFEEWMNLLGGTP